MEPKASGRCLCGSIFFVATGPLRAVFNCHCHRCRRFTGHHMAATATETPNLEVHDCAGTLDPPTFLRTVEAWWTSEASDYHTRPLLKEFDTE